MRLCWLSIAVCFLLVSLNYLEFENAANYHSLSHFFLPCTLLTQQLQSAAILWKCTSLMPEIAWPTCWKHIRASKKRIAILILTFGQNWFLLFQGCLSGFTSFGPKPFSPKRLAPQTQFIETNQPNDEVVLDFHYCLILINVIKHLGIWKWR
jgi:hypothetical protein